MSTVLVVDDEPSILDVVGIILERERHIALKAGNAAQALKAIADGGVDAVILDIVLPGRGGLDLLMEIRRDYPDLPVIVMSGKVRTDSAHFIQLSRQFGAKGILAKPFLPKELLDTLSAALP